MIDPVVVVDIDGVLCDFPLAFTQRLVEMGLLPAAIPSVDQQAWHFRDSLPITRADEDAVWAHINTSRTWWLGLPLLATKRDIRWLLKLAKRARIVYMTGRQDHNNGTYGQTLLWLYMHGFPNVSYRSLVMQDDKALGVSRIDVPVVGVIDDKPATLIALRDAGVLVTAMDRLYNAHVEGVLRAASVAEWAESVMGRLT